MHATKHVHDAVGDAKDQRLADLGDRNHLSIFLRDERQDGLVDVGRRLIHGRERDVGVEESAGHGIEFGVGELCKCRHVYYPLLMIPNVRAAPDAQFPEPQRLKPVSRDRYASRLGRAY